MPKIRSVSKAERTRHDRDETEIGDHMEMDVLRM